MVLPVTQKRTVKVRLTKIVLSTGETEVLISNLFDMQNYTACDLNNLYCLCWGIKTACGKEKNQLQLEQFSGHKPICIVQDFQLTIFVSNLQSLIEKQCRQYVDTISKKRKHGYKINKNVSWAAIKYKVFKLFCTRTDIKQLLLHLQYLFELSIEPVRPNRKAQRKKKNKRLNGKYQTSTKDKRAILILNLMTLGFRGDYFFSAIA